MAGSCHTSSAGSDVSAEVETVDGLVVLFETLADQARRGELVGISYLALSREGTYQNGTGGVFTTPMLVGSTVADRHNVC